MGPCGRGCVSSIYSSARLARKNDLGFKASADPALGGNKDQEKALPHGKTTLEVGVRVEELPWGFSVGTWVQQWRFEVEGGACLCPLPAP